MSIQSAVSYGHVGNSAAVFPLQCLGHEVWPVNTVQFSNHAGYETFGGTAMAAADIADIVDGLEARGLFPRCRAVLSGYLGTLENGAVIADAVRRVKQANSKAVYCCDPVIGDSAEGIYVGEGIADFIRTELAPVADILTPNKFELNLLTGRTADSEKELVNNAQTLIAQGTTIVAITSLVTPQPKDIATMVVTKDEAWRITTPLLSLKAKGTGDVFAALLLGHVLDGLPPSKALNKTCSALFQAIEKTSENDAQELLLVENRAVFGAAYERFAAERIF